MNTNSTVLETQLNAMREQISGSLEKAQREYPQTQKLSVHDSKHYSKCPGCTLGWYGRNYWQCPKLEGGLSAAGCSAGVTVTAKLQTAEQLTEASECVGQLKALRVATVTSTYDLEQVSEKYQQILSNCSAIDI